MNAYAASCFLFGGQVMPAIKRSGAPFTRRAASWWQTATPRPTPCTSVPSCPKSSWDEYLAWLFDFEYKKIAIPAPDMVIYLDVAPEVSQRLMTGRYHGDEAKKDIHEKDVDYLRHSRMAGAYCAGAYGWQRVPCTQAGAMRTRQAIHADVLRLAQAALTEV